MILKPASHKAVKYAVMNWHYSKTVPQSGVAFSVFEGGAFCGVICFSNGSINIQSPFNLKRGNVLELARVALNGKQSLTSKAVGLALRLVRKKTPMADIVVSYADSYEGHIGTIYQATNWTFLGSNKTVAKWINPKTGGTVHDRCVNPKGFIIQFGKKTKCLRPDQLIKIDSGVKHKYAYPLTKRGKEILKGMAKPYPKKAHEAKVDEAPASSREKGGAGPTRALNLKPQ